MKTIILHIGRHKSGTTSLQKSFWGNRDVLQKNGIYYPSSSRRECAHHLFSEELHQDNVLEQGLEKIIKSDVINYLMEEIQKNNSDTILLSSEGFQNCNSKDM